MKYAGFVSLFFLLLILGCISPSADVSKCEGITEQYQKYDCYLSVAEETRDPSVCKLFIFLPWKDECYKTVAEGRRISSECSQIRESDSKDICFVHAAEMKQDPLLCDNVQNKRYKDDCYFSIAVLKKDPDSCKYMQYGDRIRWCYMEIAHMVRDANICRGIENQNYSNLCYQTIAEFNSDPSVCDRMAPGWARDYCYEDSIKYMQNRDISICDKIERENIREACRRMVTTRERYKVNNYSTTCISQSGLRNLGDAWLESDGGTCSCTRFATFCHGGVASIGIVYPGPGQPGILVNATPLKGDSPQSKCGSFPLQRYRDACYNMLAEDEKNSTICGFIEDPTSRDSCIKRLSPKPAEPPVEPPMATPCDKISNQFERNLCYEDLAKTNRDSSICEKKITEKTSKDLCFLGVAKVKEDPSLCEKVQQEVYRELCLSYFQK
ncbi:MAG: hypothetical protein ABIF01_03350 [Candidatus Micrarchaeota archaeon]